MATNLHPVATVAALELVWPREDQASHWQRNTSKYSSTLSEYLWLKPWCSSGDKSSIITMYCRPIADSCHNRRWCTLFKPVPFFAQRTQNFGLFWPIHKNQVCVNPALWLYNATPPVQLLLLHHLLPGDEDAEQPVHPALSVHKILVDQDSYFGLRELNMDSHFGWLAKYMCFSKRFWWLRHRFQFSFDAMAEFIRPVLS